MLKNDLGGPGEAFHPPKAPFSWQGVAEDADTAESRKTGKEEKHAVVMGENISTMHLAFGRQAADRSEDSEVKENSTRAPLARADAA